MSILLYDLVGADPARPFSPHCWKVAMALAHKDLAFRSVPTPFTAIASIEGGTGKTVPMIRDGDTVVTDSYAIARYLEDTYPDRPSLFGGPSGLATMRFVERWTQTVVQAQMVSFFVADINGLLGPDDQAYFRKSREARLGKRLEEVCAGREDRLAGFRAALEPLRGTLSFQPFIGGATPLFCDYIVFGAFQWARIASPFQLLSADDPVAAWLERCLDLHGGLGRGVSAAA